MRWAILLTLLLAGCAVPPPEAYVTQDGGATASGALELSQNSVGEACIQTRGTGTAVDIYCGAWQQPSARVRPGGRTDPAGLEAMATTGPWRAALDGRYACLSPRNVSVRGAPALQLDCTGRVGGWPHVGLAVLLDGKAWLADGVVSALPVMEQSIEILDGRGSARPVTGGAAQAVLAGRRGEQVQAAPAGSGDAREFEGLMLQGDRANLADNPVAAESAFRAAVAIQQKQFGADTPNAADPMVHLALQLSNQGRFAEAEQLFARAETLVPLTQNDVTLRPRLLHYRALHEYNQHKLNDALTGLRQAEAAYTRTVPLASFNARPSVRGNLAATVAAALTTSTDRQVQNALLGVVETRRYQAVVLRDLGRLDESESMMRSAIEVAQNAQLAFPVITARLSRSAAVSASVAGESGAAIEGFGASDAAFGRAYPGSRPLALVELLRAKELVRANRTGAAVEVCRAAIRTLIEIKSGYEPERMAPCLDAFGAEAAATSGDSRQALLREMVQAAQLVRSSQTEQQINQSAARLGESSRDTRVGEAIRQQQDAAVALATIRRQREATLQARGQQTNIDGLREGANKAVTPTAFDAQEQAAIRTLADREADLQAAAPNFGQLLQQVTAAGDILRVLRPGEAFAQITLADDGGWTFLLHDGMVQAGRIRGGSNLVDPLVSRIRASMNSATPEFDAAASETLYTALFAGLPGGLDGVQAMTVAPTGSLLSLPFGVLLTGRADPSNLGGAPWLARKMSVGHLPSAGNFVSLRKLAASQAPRPWFGFGDFRPVTATQARRSFGPACGDSAALLAGLPPLASAKQELAVAAKLLGAAPGDQLLGPAFTVPAVQRTDFSGYRVLHFATHALLPSDLKCQTEPALVTSDPPGAPDASQALLTASVIARMKLDADLIILSACNSGGAYGGGGGGESLSSLARSFFYGGARALLVTHWEVSDQAATYVIADTLRRLRADPGQDVAAALAATQSELLSRAGGTLPKEFAHPFYWAPFALIGPATSAPSGRQTAVLLPEQVVDRSPTGPVVSGTQPSARPKFP